MTNAFRSWSVSAVFVAGTTFLISQAQAATPNTLSELVNQSRINEIDVWYLNKDTKHPKTTKRAFRVYEHDSTSEGKHASVFHGITKVLQESDRVLSRVEREVCIHDRRKNTNSKEVNSIPYAFMYYFKGAQRFSFIVIPCSVSTTPTRQQWAVAKLYNSNFFDVEQYVSLSSAQVNQLIQWTRKGLNPKYNIEKAKPVEQKHYSVKK